MTDSISVILHPTFASINGWFEILFILVLFCRPGPINNHLHQGNDPVIKRRDKLMSEFNIYLPVIPAYNSNIPRSGKLIQEAE